MDFREDPTVFQQRYLGIDIFLYILRNQYGFVFEGVQYFLDSIDEARAEIEFLTAEAQRRREEEEEEIPEIPIPEDLEPPIDLIELPEELEPEEPAPVLIPSIPASNVPWYAAWLEPIISYIGSLTESVVNHLVPYIEPLKDLGINLIGISQSFVDALTQGIGGIIQRGRDQGASISTQTLGEALEGTPAWMTALQDQLDTIIEPIVQQYTEAITAETYEESPIEGARAVDALKELRGKLVGAAIVQFTLHALVESGSLGQFEFMKEIDTMIVDKFGTNALIEKATMLPIEKAVLIPAEYELNSRYPNMIPTYTDLINMVVKEVISLDRFRDEMRKLGFGDEWSQYIWDAHFRPPDFTQLLNAFYRGAITREELESLKVLVDLDPRYDTVWNSLIEAIPPYSELVNELVKEVIDIDEFTKYMKWYGFDEKWSQRIWDAHFVPPSLGDIVTAWRRGIIDESRVDELMILVDLDPRFKEIFDTRKYVDPTLREGRYMYEQGAITRERLAEIVGLAGHSPDNIEPLTEYLATFQERIFKTAYLRALASGAVYGAYTPDQLREEVTAAGYSVDVAEWMLKTAEVRLSTTQARAKAPKPKLLSVGNLKRAYIDDIVSEDDLRRDLLIMGYEEPDIDILIQLLQSEKTTTTAGGKKLALSQSELLNAFRYGEVTEDYVRMELQLRGLPVDEVEILLASKKKQWGLVE